MGANNSILSEDSTGTDPFKLFNRWYNNRLAGGAEVPDSMALGTSGENGTVSVRSVLLKHFDEKGFVFFTNYKSRKGTQLQFNPLAALHFHWPESGRQIRIEGTVSITSSEESDLYFNSRPADARLSSWASEQSSIIPDRKYLEERFSFYKNSFGNKHIERPGYWGGYRLHPSWFEFWQERPGRLHDRISYTLSGDTWIINRLAP
jgi:pyridoxamine 5'-phosphate oxidase